MKRKVAMRVRIEGGDRCDIVVCGVNVIEELAMSR